MFVIHVGSYALLTARFHIHSSATSKKYLSIEFALIILFAWNTRTVSWLLDFLFFYDYLNAFSSHIFSRRSKVRKFGNSPIAWVLIHGPISNNTSLINNKLAIKKSINAKNVYYSDNKPCIFMTIFMYWKNLSQPLILNFGGGFVQPRLRSAGEDFITSSISSLLVLHEIWL